MGSWKTRIHIAKIMKPSYCNEVLCYLCCRREPKVENKSDKGSRSRRVERGAVARGSPARAPGHFRGRRARAPLAADVPRRESIAGGRGQKLSPDSVLTLPSAEKTLLLCACLKYSFSRTKFLSRSQSDLPQRSGLRGLEAPTHLALLRLIRDAVVPWAGDVRLLRRVPREALP